MQSWDTIPTMLPLFATRSNPFVDLSESERDPFAALMRALYGDAPESLKTWLKAHGASVKDVAADAVISLRPRTTTQAKKATGGSMTLHDAIHWAHARAQELVGATVFEGEVMVEDSTGASMSTYPTLAAYTFEADPDVIPLSSHAVAIEAMRLHSARQLNRSEWEAAYDAIKAAVEAAGETMPGVESRPTLRSPDKSPKSGLPDGSEYIFDRATGQVTIRASYSRKHKTALLPLLRGVPGWRRGVDFDVIFMPSRARVIAAAVQTVYPDLARVLEQHAEYWMRLAGEQAPEAVVTSEQGHTGDSNAGGVPSEDTRWRFVPDEKQVRVYTPYMARNLTAEIGPPSTFLKDDRGEWYTSVPSTVAMLDKAASALETMGSPKTAALFRTFRDGWAAVGRTAVDQSRERGAVPEEMAEWELESRSTPSGKVAEFVRLRLPRSVQYAFINNVRGAKYDSGRVYVNAKNILDAAVWLRENGLPRFAEALTRAFGGMKSVIDEEESYCATMLSMSRGVRGVVNPDEVTDAVALGAIEQVRSALRQRVVNPELQPFPFQIVGMAFAKLADYRTLIADAPGLGKTIQAIGTMIVDPEKLLPAIIVCPKNVAGNWVEEIQTWMPRVRTQLVTSQVALDPSARIYIMGYETLRDRVDEFVVMSAAAVPALSQTLDDLTRQRAAKEAKKEAIPIALTEDIAKTQKLLLDAQQYPEKDRIRYFIADEAHKFKNPTAKWSRAGRLLASAIPHVLFLSGTPMMNNLAELHSILSMLHPDKWGTEAAFKRQYVEKRTVVKMVKGKRKEVEVEALKNAPELHKRMGCQIIRRRKMDALADLVAPKKRQKVAICVTEKEAQVYDEAVREYERYVRAFVERKIREAVNAEIDTFLADSGMRRVDVERQEREDILHAEYGIRRGYYDEAAFLARGIPLADVQQRAEQRAEKKINAALEAQGMTRAAIEDRVQAKVEEAVEAAMRAEILTQLGRLLELIGQFKVPAVMEMVRVIHAHKAPAAVTKSKRVAPEGIVIFAKHASVMDAYKKALKEEGIKFGVIDGGAKSTPEARMKVVKDFQNGDLDVVLASEAGREGLTLTRAKYLIMAQRYWNPAAEQQAEDRIHRIGQKRDATILFPYIVRAHPEDAEGATADDYMQRIIASKRGLVGEAIGDDEIEESTLGEDEVSEDTEDLLDATSEESSVFATVKALRKGGLCVDPTLARDSVAAVRREVAANYEAQMRQNPRAFSPRPVPARSEVQTILFDRRAWSKAAAEAWLRHHGYVARGVDTTEHYHRFRQHDPHLYVPGSFRTISFTSSIKAVVGRRG